VEDMDSYLQYVGGSTGLGIAGGIAAASALYYATRPVPEKPLVPLDNQSPVLEVSTLFYFHGNLYLIFYIVIKTKNVSFFTKIVAKTNSDNQSEMRIKNNDYFRILQTRF
jgi:hypothetical protein